LPVLPLSGIRAEIARWQDLAKQVEAGDDERASVLGRSRGERFLKRLLYFYASTGQAPHLIEILKNPGAIRIPRRIESILESSPEVLPTALQAVLREEGWAELGFLTLVLAKLSSLIESTRTAHVDGSALVVFDRTDQEAFVALSKALQAYTHDNPSTLEVRGQELSSACVLVAESVERLVTRRVAPDQLLVTETSATIFGTAFRGLVERGHLRTLKADGIPSLGARVMFVASTERDQASCLWCDDPWPQGGTRPFRPSAEDS